MKEYFRWKARSFALRLVLWAIDICESQGNEVSRWFGETLTILGGDLLELEKAKYNFNWRDRA